ncbi:MAG: SLBB domain-containing protein [Treponema sp.]|nr:SLBB domain-containing protein [Treponema sp.]
MSARLLLALSTADYPATPGDVYSLSYFAAALGGAVTTPLSLDAGYQLKVQNMGTLNGRGKTYLQLRAEVVNLVSRNYPMSGAAFTLTQIGRFEVLVTGEISIAGTVPVDGLTRLSALTANVTEKASTRFVQVSSASGRVLTYDLFLAYRFGDLSQDPYVRPGDKIHIPPAGRIVSLSGEVFRPGTYELLPEESLEALVSYYGGGFTLKADQDLIRVSRIHTPEGIPGETQFVSYKEAALVSLEDRDSVFIANKEVNRPVAFFEGAISQVRMSTERSTVVQETSGEIEGTSKMEYPFYQGETLGNAVRTIRDRFSLVSDLANTYILRKGQQIPVDLRPFLYNNDFSHDVALENGDTVIVPFRQYFVLVSGAVKAPGRYPYVPDRRAEYYINLAGGRDELMNNGRGIKAFDMNNKSLSLEGYIPPESMISVPINTFTAKFNQVGPIITTILSILSTTLSILAITGAL